MQFLPVSATETVIREISYAVPDDRREMKAARHLNWRINRRVNAEDTELITRVQLGMQSPSYKAGPLGTSEVCLRSFARSCGGLFLRRGWNRPLRQGGRNARVDATHDRRQPVADRQQHETPGAGFQSDAETGEDDEEDARADDEAAGGRRGRVSTRRAHRSE